MKFLTEEDTLTIRLEGLEAFFALKRRLMLSRQQIGNLAWHPEFTFSQRIWRVAGAGIPGVLYAGRFRGGGLRYFLYLQRPRGISLVQADITSQDTLVITTQNYAYDQILISCDAVIGTRLVKWWQRA